MTSLTIATIEQSIALKSIQALRMDELIATVPSWTEVIFVSTFLVAYENTTTS